MEKKKKGKILSNRLAIILIGAVAVWSLILGLVIDGYAFTLLGLGTIAAILIFNAVVIVPVVHFGIPTRVGKRIKKADGKVVILHEGFDFVLPLIDDLEEKNIISKKLTTKEIKTKAISRDRLEVFLVGSLQYSPFDPNTYIEREPETISKGLVDAIESEFGKVCGTKDADAFVKSRTEIEVLINCVLRLKRPPHYFFNEATEKSKQEFPLLEIVANKVMGKISELANTDKKKAGKLSPKKWKLKELEKEGEPESKEPKKEEKEIDILAFYRDNTTRISLILDLLEEQQPSPIEKLYGIGVAIFRAAKIGFSEKVQKAFEEERSAIAEMKAAEVRFKKKKQLLEGYIKAGISPEAAVNLIETTTDVKGVERQIISVEGSHSMDLLAFAKLLGGGGKK
ncbi:hypothetical protein GW816_00280 [Candidatus Wolfebacteria bacterium]|nr:hypothetical protein [Candidatus Wolfebacteria bacterium]